MAAASTPSMIPLHIFRFKVELTNQTLGKPATGAATEMAFSECTGLEATMEPKTIKEGGRNYGAAQRAGSVTFATVILKRGVSLDRGMWTIFNQATSGGGYSLRLSVKITLLDGALKPIFAWQLTNAMPVKFKFADFNARGTEVGIEELHFVHEGLSAA